MTVNPVMFAIDAVSELKSPVVKLAREAKRLVEVALPSVVLPALSDPRVEVPLTVKPPVIVVVASVVLPFAESAVNDEVAVVDVAVKYGATTAPPEASAPTFKRPAVSDPESVRFTPEMLPPTMTAPVIVVVASDDAPAERVVPESDVAATGPPENDVLVIEPPVIEGLVIAVPES